MCSGQSGSLHVEGFRLALRHHFRIYVQRGARTLLPAELTGALQTQAFHSRAKLRIEEDVGHGPRNRLRLPGIEEEPRSVRDLWHRRRVRTGDCAATRHGLQDRDAKPFVKRGKYKTIAGVVEIQQLLVADEAGEMNSIAQPG